MPTQTERDYYRMGFRDGIAAGGGSDTEYTPRGGGLPYKVTKTKRKLSAWNKYVKANSKKPRFRYRNGKLNLKKMAIAFRKTPAGRKRKK